MALPRLPLLVLLGLAACTHRPQIPPPTPLEPYTPLYDPTDVTVYLAPEVELAVDDDCDPAPEFSNGLIVSRTLSGVFAHRGFRVVDSVRDETIVLKPMFSRFCGFSRGAGTVALDVVRNGVLIDRVTATEHTEVAYGVVLLAEFGEVLADQLEKSKSIAATVRRGYAKPDAVALMRPASLLVLPIKAGPGVDSGACGRLTHLLLSKLDNVKRLRTVDIADVETTLGVDKQKQVLGCDGVACMAEIGGALGVDAIMYAELGPLGSQYALNISVVRASDAQVVARMSVLSSNIGDALVPELDRVVTSFVDKFNERMSGQ